ncbi:DUF6515 family protein [Pseudoteredinibacter isoporae]|uniref:Uncharacterized protein n=1 Tax=Pseudoteredinibacter isoporae TaxID=570281 RepID=A0A7X0JRK3_9GAMM|nr:DUF6515 family protein [Pseudoteredinibacter isoporae]MBB6520977.1 hypothetical protein [Pseudoteredinibacter isoporae]NHO86542.1 hypothetical protein [Pseudoteredinibacter isoporae]NIB25006.1 hypothetical protein [Pseudoteredinibacter isoporae]
MKPSSTTKVAISSIALIAGLVLSQQSIAHKVKTVTVHKHGGHHHQLPKVHAKFVWKGLHYFVAGGLFYRYIDNHYTVVATPHGARLKVLPGKGKIVIVNSQHYHLVNGHYYRYNKKHHDYVLVKKPHKKHVKVVAHI